MKNFFKQYDIEMPELYEQENEENPIAHAHFIAGEWEWFVTEASERDGDLLLFGLVNGDEKELRYFTLMQLASVVQDWTLTLNPSEYSTYMRILT